MVKQWQKLAALKYVCFINILRSNEGGINNWMFLIAQFYSDHILVSYCWKSYHKVDVYTGQLN